MYSDSRFEIFSQTPKAAKRPMYMDALFVPVVLGVYAEKLG